MERNNNLTTFTNEVKNEVDVTAGYSLEMSMEKPASTWLSALALKAHIFHLNKSAFKDAVHFRYGWIIPDTPSTCQCGHNFFLDHFIIVYTSSKHMEKLKISCRRTSTCLEYSTIFCSVMP